MSSICLADNIPEAVEADCKPMGRPGGRGPVLRLHVREGFECSKGDVLIFDFNLVPRARS